MQKQTKNVTQWFDDFKIKPFHALLILLVSLTLIFDGYDSQIIAYFMPHLIKEWQLTPILAGSVASYGFFGLMVGAAGLGMISDRIGRKKPLIWALAGLMAMLIIPTRWVATRRLLAQGCVPAAGCWTPELRTHFNRGGISRSGVGVTSPSA